MSDDARILQEAERILVVDWPSRDVPDALVFAGYTVFVKGGPGPRDYAAQELRAGQVVPRDTGARPDRIDLVYVHRPRDELPGLIRLAQEIGAKSLWLQSGLAGADAKDPKGCWLAEEDSLQARELVESAGLRYVDDVYIGDAARKVDDASTQ